MKKITSLSIFVSSIFVLCVGAVTIVPTKPPVYHVVSFDSQGGTEIESVRVIHGNTVKRPTDPEKLGFTFSKWLFENSIWDFDTNVVEKDITIVADWDIVEYQITYDFDGGFSIATLPTTYTVESNFTLVTPQKDSSVFSGWYSQDNERIDAIVPGMTGDLFLSAKWLDCLDIKSLDETRGTINVYSDGQSNKVTIENNPVDNKYHLFKGWFDGNGNLISTNDSIVIEKSTDYVTTVCAKYMTDEEENAWNEKHAIHPVLSANNSDVLMYGLYPQSVVEDNAITEKLSQLSPKSDIGLYYYEHEYYFKKKAKIARNQTTGELLQYHNFDNGNEIEDEKDYWFALEPISWRIIHQEDNRTLLLSDKLLDVKEYYHGWKPRIIDNQTIMPNNYKYSDIRKWLNENFLNTSFAFNKSELQIMEIDNSAATTIDDNNIFTCENTEDYVSLLSFKDYLNSNYGFGDDKSYDTRLCLTTDFSRVSGANYFEIPDSLYCGYYWTRSPYYDVNNLNDVTSVSRINKSGGLNHCDVGYDGSCVQPIICITA